MKTTLLIMTLNEIDGMKAIMPRIDRAWVDQILVIDGGSTDGTVEWARENDYQVHQQKQTSIRMGYKEAWHLIEGDVVMTFSPDGNSIPEKIPEVFAKMREGSDMVVAARYLGDATSDDDDDITGFGNWFYTRTANLLFGANDADVMVIFRAYRKDLIHQLGLLDDDAFNWVERLFGCPYATLSWEPILSVRAHKYGYTVGEIPASEPLRISGKRKLKVFRWGAAIYCQFLREFVTRASPELLARKNTG